MEEETRYLILGLGLSGRAAAELMLSQGWTPVAYDDNGAQLMHDPEVQQLSDAGLQLSLELPLLEDYDVLVVSPGVPPTHPVYEQAIEEDMEVIGEAELALRICPMPFLGITGSNGKTTTTLLVEHILQVAGRQAKAMGNNGEPMCATLPILSPETVPVVELSSYQLDTMTTPLIASGVLLNIHEDHLDRYGTVERYAASKLHIADLIEPEGVLYIHRQVLQDHPDLAERVRCHTFASSGAADVTVESGWLVMDGTPTAQLPDALAQMRGHDIDNMLAAFCLCAEQGLTPEIFFAGMTSFSKPPHRLQMVRQHAGVTFFDDSKGTNLSAVAAAVRAMPGPVLLIAGGRHKGVSYSSWIQGFEGRVRQVFAIGEAAEQIAEEIGGHINVHQCHSLDEAVAVSAQMAKTGECVLLSPGCASFDMFKNYEQRGLHFQDLVKAL